MATDVDVRQPPLADLANDGFAAHTDPLSQARDRLNSKTLAQESSPLPSSLVKLIQTRGEPRRVPTVSQAALATFVRAWPQNPGQDLDWRRGRSLVVPTTSFLVCAMATGAFTRCPRCSTSREQLETRKVADAL